MNNQRTSKTYQITMRMLFPEEQAICLKATSEENISIALLSLMHMLFQSLAERGHIDILACRENNLKKYLKETEEKTKEDFVKDTLEILKKSGWKRICWSDFRNIPKAEYTDYLEIVQRLVPINSAIYEELRKKFNSTLCRPRRGVRRQYLMELISAISYVSASGYHQKETEENKDGN